jgi:hypothetical protein
MFHVKHWLSTVEICKAAPDLDSISRVPKWLGTTFHVEHHQQAAFHVEHGLVSL